MLELFGIAFVVNLVERYSLLNSVPELMQGIVILLNIFIALQRRITSIFAPGSYIFSRPGGRYFISSYFFYEDIVMKIGGDNMPRMSKKDKVEWDFYLDENGRIRYNELCRNCDRECKQSFRAMIISCPEYSSKRRKKKE